MDSAGSPNPVAAFSAILPADELALLESAGIVRKFAAGTPVMHEGDPSEHVLIIRHGCVKVVASAAGGTQVLLGIRGPGDLVGELAGLDGQPRRGTVVTIDRVDAVVVPGTRFVQLMTERPALSLAVARVVSERLAESDRYRLAVGTVGVAPALAGLVLDLIRRYGARTGDGALVLELGLTQKDLADCLAVSPRTVARTIAAWRKAGVISTGRRSIVVRRPGTLHAYSDAR